MVLSGEFWGEVAGLLAEGRPVVLATIIAKEGSGPRQMGTTMAVSADGKGVGTIGGGLLEKEVIRLAGLVHLRQRSIIEGFPLEAEGEMSCGGRLEVLFHYLDPADQALKEVFAELLGMRQRGACGWLVRSISGKEPAVGVGLLAETLVQGSLNEACLEEMRLRQQCRQREAVRLELDKTICLIQPLGGPETVFIFGAGHVAKALASLCGLIDFRTVIIDDRRELATADRFPAAAEIRLARDPAGEIPRLAIDDTGYVVIMTHSHRQDAAVLAAALKTRARYIGMISSRRKKETVFKSLGKKGVGQEQLRRVHSPIGLDIGAQTPEEIAVSIAAELIAVRAGRMP